MPTAAGRRVHGVRVGWGIRFAPSSFDPRANNRLSLPIHTALTYGLSLSRHEHNLLPHVDVVREPQQAGNHQLRAVADGVNGRILDDDPLLVDEEELEGPDDAAEVLLVLGGVVDVLGVEDVVHGDHVVVLGEDAGAHAPQLARVREVLVRLGSATYGAFLSRLSLTSCMWPPVPTIRPR